MMDCSSNAKIMLPAAVFILFSSLKILELFAGLTSVIVRIPSNIVNLTVAAKPLGLEIE